MARPKKTTTNMTTLADGITACAKALDQIPLIMRPHVLETLHKQTTLDLAIIREQVRQQQARQPAAIPEPEFTADLPTTDEGEVAAMDQVPERREIPEVKAEVTS